MLAFEDEPCYVGLRLRSKTEQVCLLHDLIVATGAQKRLVQLVHDLSVAAVGFTQKLYAVLPAGKSDHTQSAAPRQKGLPHSQLLAESPVATPPTSEHADPSRPAPRSASGAP